MKIFQKVLFLGIFSFLTLFAGLNTHAAINGAPSFGSDFAEKVRVGVDNGDEKMYDYAIDKKADLKENIRSLFYPTGGGGGQLRDLVRKILYGIIALAIVYVGIMMIWDAKEGKIGEWSQQLIYIIVGIGFALGGIWAINSLTIDSGSADLIDTLESNILFDILTLLKALAFFVAIVLLMRNGYQMMSTASGEDKMSKGKDGVLVVLVALIFIKGIDYVYYVAASPNVKEEATLLIINIAKMMAYLLGGAFIVFMLYAGYRLISDGGKGEGMNEFKKVVVGVLLGAMVIALFLLIMYQVVLEFA